MPKHAPNPVFIILCALMIFLAISTMETSENSEEVNILILNRDTSISGDEIPPSSGNWIIDEDTTIVGGTIDVPWNIYVQHGVSLSISSATFCFNNDSCLFHVSHGVDLEISDCTFTTSNGYDPFNMQLAYNTSVGGTDELNATITTCTFDSFNQFYVNNRYGDISLTNVRFQNWTDEACRIFQCDNIFLEGCTFDRPTLQDDCGDMALHFYFSQITNNAEINNCLFRNIKPDEYVIYVHDTVGNIEITNCRFYGNDMSDSATPKVIDVISNDIYLEGNEFISNLGTCISARPDTTDNITITGNTFERSLYHVKSGPPIEIASAFDCLIERNRIYDMPYEGINVRRNSILDVSAHNLTIRYNCIFECDEAGIFLEDESHNVTIYGNAIIGSDVGVEIDSTSYNNTIIENAFINILGSYYSIDANGTNYWDNGTHGNLWTNYGGVDTNEDWVGDTAIPLNIHENITEDYPLMKIGYLPSGPGTWSIDRPHIIFNKDFDIPGSVSVSTQVGVFGVLFSTIQISSPNTFSFSEDTSFFLIFANLQENGLDGTYATSFDDLFYFYIGGGGMYNITAGSGLEFGCRFFSITDAQFNFTPGIRMTMWSGYDSWWHDQIPVEVINCVFQNITSDVKFHREILFEDNIIVFDESASPNSWVEIDRTPNSPFAEYYEVLNNHISGGKLNVTILQTSASLNITDNYAENGFLIEVLLDNIITTYCNISGNSVDSGGMSITASANAPNIELDVRHNHVGSGGFTFDSDCEFIDISYTTVNSGKTTINAAPNALMDHCTLMGDLDIDNSDGLKFLNGYVDGLTDIDLCDGIHLNGTDFNDGMVGIGVSDNAVIANNTFYNYSEISFGQIYVDECDYLTIFDNDFDNVTYAMTIRDSSDFCVIEANTMNLAGYYGIYVDLGCQNMTIIDNIIGNGSYAVYVYEYLSYTFNMTIIENEFGNLTNYAVRIIGGNYHTISYNTIYNVSADALYVYGTHYPVFEYNTIWDVSGSGINTRGNNITIVHNRINHCDIYGIYLRSGGNYYNLSMHNNSVTYCGSHGVNLLLDYRNATIYNNTFAFNKGWGLNAGILQDSQLWLNYFYENVEGSIYIDWGGGNQLDNGVYGNFYPEYRGAESGAHWIGSDPFEVRGANNDLRGTDNYPIMGMGNVPAIGDPFPSGDWIVDELTIVLGVNKSIDGDMIITSTGNLTLIGAEISFITGGVYWSRIEVQTGGALKTTDGTKLTSDQIIKTYGLSLQIGATLHMQDVFIERCGYPDNFNDPAFRINITTVSLSNITFKNCYTGIILFVSDITLHDMHFIDCSYGISCRGNDNIVQRARFDNVTWAIEASVINNLTVRDCDFGGSTLYGFYFADVDDCHIYSNRFEEIPTCIRLNSLCDNNQIYLNFFSGSTAYLSDQGTGNTMNNGTHGNFYLDYTGYDYDGDLIGDTSYVDNGVNDPYPLMIWGSLPSDNPGWEVTIDTYVLATNYTLQGALNVYDDAELYMMGAMLWMNCTDQEQFITVKDGGRYYQWGGWLKAINNSKRFKFDAETLSYLYVNGTEIEGCYYFATHTNDTYIYEITLTNVYDGLYLWGQPDNRICNLTISGCVVNGVGNKGIRAKYGYNLNFTDWEFYNSSNHAISLVECADSILKEIYVNKSGVAIYIEKCSGTIETEELDIMNVGNCFYIRESDTVVIKGLTANVVTNNAIFARETSNVTVIDSNFYIHSSGTVFHPYYRMYRFYARNCYCFNGKYGVRTWDASVLIQDCEFRNFTYGVDYYDFGGTTDIVNFTGNLFYGCDYGLELLSGNSISTIVFDNDFEYVTNVIWGLDGDLQFTNNTITHATYGIYTEGGSHPYYAYNSYTDCTYPYHIYGGAHNGTFHNETIVGCERAVHFSLSENITLGDFHITDCIDGFYIVDVYNMSLTSIELDCTNLGYDIETSKLIKMRDCIITSAYTGIEFAAWNYEDYNHDIDASNLYKGKPIIYIFNETGTTYSEFDTYHLSIMYCERVTVTGAKISGDTINLRGLANCTLANSTISTSISTYVTHDMLFIGNTFEFAGRLNFTRDYGDTNLTFTLNAFMSSYYFYSAESQWIMNASDYGNYWYNYAGIDEDEDGIGDTPHGIGGGNYDYLPLVTNPYGARAYITNLIPANETVVCDTIHVSVTVAVLGGIKYDGPLSTDTSVTLNGTEVGSGATGTIEFDLDTSSYSDGIYILKATAVVDSSFTYYILHVITIDNTGPILEPSIEDTWATDSMNPSLDVRAVDTLSNIAWIAAFLDGLLVDNQTMSYQSATLYFSPELTVQKAYELCLRAEDALGNFAEINLTIYYDTTNPELSGPSEFSYVEGTTGNEITFTASDLTPSHYNVTVDGEDFTSDVWDGGNIVINIDGFSAGGYSLNVQVYDRVGHSTYQSVTITVTESTATTTTTTTPTTTGPTTETTTTTTTTTGEPFPTEIIIVIVVAGGVIFVIILVIMMKKRKK